MFHLIDAEGYAHPLPCTLRPSHWLGSLHPRVHGFIMNTGQVRTDDYGRDAEPLQLEGDLKTDSPVTLHAQADNLREVVRRARWLHREDTGASTRLLEGNDIELDPKTPLHSRLRVVLVQADRRWFGPDGREVSG